MASCGGYPPFCPDLRGAGRRRSLRRMSTGNEERPLDEGASGRGADLGAGEETTFEPEEDPDAVEEPEQE